MKKLLSFVVTLVLVSTAFSQGETLKKVSEYKEELSDLQTWGKNLTNDKFYEEHINFKDKKTNKEQKFSQFSEFDRRMFQIITTQKFNVHLEKLAEAWQKELKNVTGKVPNSNGKEDMVAGVDDINKFITGLTKLRNEAVKSWETQTVNIFKNFPKEFEEKDKTDYLNNIKSMKEKLEKKK